ncbi:short-chain dehydrogenase/reductase SDR, partial [human gut metagenome]
MLFDKIASIPLMENRERATTVFKTVFSNKFLKAFGDWRKRVPINKPAYNKVKSNIDLIPEAYRERVLSKGAVINFTRQLANEWAQYGITVNTLSPGFFASEQSPVGQGWFADFINTWCPMKRNGSDHELDA